MAYGLYNLALALGLPVGLCALAGRLAARPEYRPALAERFGRIAPSPAGTRVVWLHAVSVGEMISAVPLVRALRDRMPGAHLVVSCCTPTGRATAGDRLAGVADRVIYLPYDYPLLVNAALARVRPDLFLLVETEIWPNLLRALARRGTPVFLVNGRVSRRSFPRYLAGRPLFRAALAEVAGCLMQSRRDARRIRRMGAPPERVEVTGNLKYDQPQPQVSAAELKRYRAALAIPEGAPVLLAGSTHEGEEEALARIWSSLRAEAPGLMLVLAVRHPPRAEGVVRRLADLGIRAGRKSLGDCRDREVVLLDTVGELAAHYRLATVAFVGGSLVPVGGHNPLEPAAAGVPVVYGPHVSNFLEPCAALEAAGGALRVSGEEDLAARLGELLGDEAARKRMGEAGQAVFRENRGALERTMARLEAHLPKDGG